MPLRSHIQQAFAKPPVLWTIGYLLVWFVGLWDWRGTQWLPAWLLLPLFAASVPLGLYWQRRQQSEIARRFGIPEWKIEERQKAIADPARYEGLVKAARAGVPIVFGTDAGSPAVEHDVVAPELAHMVKVGVCSDTMDALASITTRAAKLSKMDHLVGTLEEGKAADLIVVDGNPDEDLFALERVKTTFVGGRRMYG